MRQDRDYYCLCGRGLYVQYGDLNYLDISVPEIRSFLARLLEGPYQRYEFSGGVLIEFYL